MAIRTDRHSYIGQWYYESQYDNLDIFVV